MPIRLPELPYKPDALEPIMSKETFSYHYGKHHAKYVQTLNELIKGTDYESMGLREIMFESWDRKDKKVFNNAAQTWNHTFFWMCMNPEKKPISDKFKQKLAKDFGSYEEFVNIFQREALGQFGSGWAWLVKDQEGRLLIKTSANAENPMMEGLSPLLTCDVWEHAYYIDYRNDRAKFVSSFFQVIDWQFVESNYERKLDRSASVEIRSNLWL